MTRDWATLKKQLVPAEDDALHALTKLSLETYVKGYILALQDVLKDLYQVHEAGGFFYAPVMVGLNESLQQAYETLAVLQQDGE